MGSYISQGYLYLSKCHKLDWNSISVLQFLIPSRYPLHHISSFVQDSHQEKKKSDIDVSQMLFQLLLRSSSTLITRMKLLAPRRVVIKVTKESHLPWF